MKQNHFYQALCLSMALLLTGCTFNDTVTERERIEARFEEELGCRISTMQWWETSVKIYVDVTTDSPVRLWLTSAPKNGLLYDYKEIQASGPVTLTAPQGQGNTVYLTSYCSNKIAAKPIALTGKPIETVSLDTQRSTPVQSPSTPFYQEIEKTHPGSLVGSSVAGNAEYFEFNDSHLASFLKVMGYLEAGGDYLTTMSGSSDDYELSSNGPFHVIWADGWEAAQTSHILGYYYHSPGTYDDIEYVDLSETHQWDYIDGLSKLQYQIDIDDVVEGIHFYPGQWYDANFDMNDGYGSTQSNNMDRLYDSAFNMRKVYERYGNHISAFRGISFLVDVPVGKHIGLYLRSETEPFPNQWSLVKSKRVPPYVSNQNQFHGTCFSAKELNVDGVRRSIIWDEGSAIWMGMEDYVVGGDNDCDDVFFCVLENVGVCKPDIVLPDLALLDVYNDLFPWTLAFEDVDRDADFDFNDAVIKLVPDYQKELCCVTAMAVGSTDRMYLYYDGPDGEINLGELHQAFGNSGTYKRINTEQSMITNPVVSLDCVPWPKGYTMEQDARRFSIRIQRGTCEDCTDTLSLATAPGELPEALLVAGEWKWPVEKTSIVSAYSYFSNWSQDPSTLSYWNWYKNGNPGTYVSY